MTVSETLDSGQRHKLTREWGDEWARGLWDEVLGRFEISWQGTTVLDFGCAWGYVTKFLVEHAGVAHAHGVDLHPMWEGMTDGYRPYDVAGVHLHAGDVRELPALQRLHFDTIVSLGTVFLLEPTQLMNTLHWFYDHLKPGGSCVLQTRTYSHYDGADLGSRAPRFAHLLFSERDIAAHLDRAGSPPARLVNASCAATYLVQFARAGFAIERVNRTRDGIDEALIEEHAAKLQWLDPEELRTSGLEVHLRRPSMSDLSVLDRDARGD
jgi:SAM-dependent methyltransferase